MIMRWCGFGSASWMYVDPEATLASDLERRVHPFPKNVYLKKINSKWEIKIKIYNIIYDVQNLYSNNITLSRNFWVTIESMGDRKFFPTTIIFP